MYPLIKIGSFGIPTYGLMAVLGFGFALLLFLKISKSYKIRTDDGIYAAIYCIIGVLIGSKLLSAISLLPRVIIHFDIAIKHPLEVLGRMFGGYVFYGGLIGAAVGVWIYCRKFKLDIISFMDAAAPVIPFMHAFGRIGCFLAGCCYGIEYHGPFAVTFPTTGYTADMGGIPRVPTQLMEVVYDLILFTVLMIYMRRKPRAGRGLGIYIVAYAVMRFGIEFVRGDIIRGGFFGLSTSQWVSLILLPIGLALIHGINFNHQKRA